MQHLSLYFFNSINDLRMEKDDRYLTDHLSLRFSAIESIANGCLKNYFLRNSISVYNDLVTYSTLDELLFDPEIYNPTIQKIVIIFFETIFLIPAVCLKIIFAIANISYVYQRNMHIIQQKNLENSFQRKFVEKKLELKFAKPSVSSKDRLSLIPKDLFIKILTYATDQEINFWARTCQYNYKNVTYFATHAFREDCYYASSLVKALNPQFAKLNLSVKVDWGSIFTQLSDGQRLVQVLNTKMKKMEGLVHPNPYQSPILRIKNVLSQLEDLVEKGLKDTGQSVIKISLSNGYAIVMQIKEYPSNKTQILIFTKKKLANFNWKLSKNLFKFLSELYSSDTTRSVEYMRRLLNNQPCGNFPDSVEEIEQNNDSSSGLLEEGPVVCEDRHTPVIQLC